MPKTTTQPEAVRDAEAEVVPESVRETHRETNGTQYIVVVYGVCPHCQCEGTIRYYIDERKYDEEKVRQHARGLTTACYGQGCEGRISLARVDVFEPKRGGRPSVRRRLA